jgi:hypothetical protein
MSKKWNCQPKILKISEIQTKITDIQTEKPEIQTKRTPKIQKSWIFNTRSMSKIQ